MNYLKFQLPVPAADAARKSIVIVGALLGACLFGSNAHANACDDSMAQFNLESSQFNHEKDQKYRALIGPTDSRPESSPEHCSQAIDLLTWGIDMAQSMVPLERTLKLACGSKLVVDFSKEKREFPSEIVRDYQAKLATATKTCQGTASRRPPSSTSNRGQSTLNQSSGSCSDVTGLGGASIPCPSDTRRAGIPGDRAGKNAPARPRADQAEVDAALAVLNEIFDGLNESPSPPAPPPAAQPPTPQPASQPEPVSPKCVPYYHPTALEEAKSYLERGRSAEAILTCDDLRAAQGHYLNAANFFECAGDLGQSSNVKKRADYLGRVVDQAEEQGLCRRPLTQAGASQAPPRGGACGLTDGQLQVVLDQMTKLADATPEDYTIDELGSKLRHAGCDAPKLRDCVSAVSENRLLPGCRSKSPPPRPAETNCDRLSGVRKYMCEKLQRLKAEAEGEPGDQ